MTDAQALQFLHWFWVGFFVFFGFLVLRTCNFSASSPSAMRFFRVGDCAFATRLRAVLARRGEVERISNAVRVVPSVASFVVAAVAAFTPVQPGVLYGVLMLAIAASMAVAFSQLRNTASVRIAMLQHRSPSMVIPPAWIALAAVQGLFALLRWHQLPIGAAFVAISTLTCAALAWRVTEMPAVLLGEDLPVERLADDRLRFQRASAVLTLAFAQTFVFVTQTFPPESNGWDVASIASGALCLAFLCWYAARLFAKIDPASVAA